MAVQEYAIAAAPRAYIIGLESTKGVFTGRGIFGYSWFVGTLDQPSPAHFGESLANIERFLWDEIDRQPAGQKELPFLLGVEQGAIMALATAAAVPDLLSGVIAIDAAFPIVPGWMPPLAPLDRLPILVIDTPLAPQSQGDALRGRALVDQFKRWNAEIAYRRSCQDIPQDDMDAWLAGQSRRYMDCT
jgi:pimeloyl-ACP methyl ester carboxylesterase